MGGLDSVFKMFDLPEFGTPAKSAANKNRDFGSESKEADLDLDMMDLFRAIDKNNTEKSDPMNEFERILSDLAIENAEVYKSARPAPLFWDENQNNKRGGQRGKDGKSDDISSLLDGLSSDTLFEEGPRSSAYSAGVLEADPGKVSSLANRIKENASTIQYVEDATAAQTLKKDKNKQGQNKSRFREIEQIHLSQLSVCHSVAGLSKFIHRMFSDIRKPAVGHDSSQRLRPSPMVFNEIIRVSRELKEPQIAFYMYNYCRIHMDLIDKLNILDSKFYEELIATTWSLLRDTSALTFILQDAVALGVIGKAGLIQQVEQIITDLKILYNLSDLANHFVALKNKLDDKPTYKK
ncbi:hypothetical protein GGI07_005538 [Coemansia sp. Benny D115]|nr:hypothetical protein GGI07_005538 [Coemansia sp. Benny D115]